MPEQRELGTEATPWFQRKMISDIDVDYKTVLVRVDFNVPFRPGTTEPSDDSRISAAIPTIRHLLDRRCRVVLCSHLGRPKGKVVEDLRMAPVTERLSQLLGMPVAQAPSCVGEEARHAVGSLGPDGVLMLENLRFHAGEEQNDEAFARELASLAEVYVNDAFGTAHRAHASTEGVTRFLPSVAGFLMQRELEMLGQALESPRHPFAAVLGGAKVSDKIGVLEELADRVDVIVIGGGMAATFLKAKSLSVGESLVEDEWLDFAAGFIEAAPSKGIHLALPTDSVVADAFAVDASHRIVEAGQVPDGWRMMDIGPETICRFEEALRPSRTVVWNGPLGVFEWKPFAQGTVRIAEAVAGLTEAATIVGGGSTAEAVEALGLADRMTHVSTGGGASLEFLQGKVLPGVAALMPGWAELQVHYTTHGSRHRLP